MDFQVGQLVRRKEPFDVAKLARRGRWTRQAIKRWEDGKPIVKVLKVDYYRGEPHTLLIRFKDGHMSVVWASKYTFAMNED